MTMHYISLPKHLLPVAAAALMLNAASAAAQDAPLPGRGTPPLSARTKASGLPLTPAQQALDLKAVDLSIEIFPDQHAIAGTGTLSFTARRASDKVQFDLDANLPISAIALDGTPLPPAAWTNADGLVTVRLPVAAATGRSFALAVSYAGQPHVAANAPWDGGFVWDRTPDGKPWIATAVQGEGCDLFWPCIDNPTVDVPRIDLHITVPAALSAPSNGELIGVDRLPDGRSRWNWRARNISAYAVALNIAPYEELKSEYTSRFGNRIPMRFWHLPQEGDKPARLFQEFAQNLSFMEAMVGPYPFGDEKMGVAETPHLGMEHQTINAYGNQYKPAPEGFDWLLNHEFAHEWFGNQMTNADWDDMWLHEGFATYMQPLYAQWRGGDMAYMAWLWKIRQLVANRFPIVSGHSRTEDEVYDASTGPANDIYYKGALMLHTLRGLIGDRAFFTSIRRLVYGRADPAPGNFRTRVATTSEYQAIVAQEAGRNLDWFFDAYLRQAALPDLKTERKDGVLKLRWVTGDRAPFPLPVEVQVDGRLTTLPMAGGRGEMPVPDGAHVLIDPMSKLLRQDDDMDRFRDREKAK